MDRVETAGRCSGGLAFRILDRIKVLKALIPVFGATECFEILNPVPGSE